MNVKAIRTNTVSKLFPDSPKIYLRDEVIVYMNVPGSPTTREPCYYPCPLLFGQRYVRGDSPARAGESFLGSLQFSLSHFGQGVVGDSNSICVMLQIVVVIIGPLFVRKYKQRFM